MSRRKRLRVGDIARIVEADVRPAAECILDAIVRVVKHDSTKRFDNNGYPYTVVLLTNGRGYSDGRGSTTGIGDELTLERADMCSLDPGIAALYGIDMKENGQ